MKSLTPILLIIISAGLFFTFVDSTYEETKSLNAQIEINKETIELGNRLRDRQVEIENEYKNISSEERERMNKILPDAIDNVRLIVDINNLAKRIDFSASDFGIKITNINVVGEQNQNQTANQNNRQQSASNTSEIGTIQLSFTIEAGYESFKTFLEELERSLRIVDVVDFTIGSGRVVDTKQVYNYSITINTYWLR
ncbi:MAG TPA: type 4a pilus biogenesis protein PilO [Candidatus Paceibacterota bacterium]|nr:type 4a pilus biogenesis protein PilO [Candidatus Paceibacterota bacterium]HMP19171.1 type 4a pilus biogenesis protein PilO [Candidatus Paceibacterota bacterium]HMP85222.1 type 4a pilus biogenesis protein PilO [Candidatus Paceibacterota bacterium]